MPNKQNRQLVPRKNCIRNTEGIILDLFSVLFIISTLGKNCDDILCADVFDDVCGMAEAKDGTQIIMQYKNICYMRKKECEMASAVEIKQVPDEWCGIWKEKVEPKHDEYPGESRRVNDFSIVGAHQVCNHTCPTYCADIYQPACAQIWKRNMRSYSFRTMVNHCHIDLLSCSTGVNVTIQPLGKCYKNPSGLMFMQQAAALKSLNLLADDDNIHYRRTNEEPKVGSDVRDKIMLKKQLQEVVRRIFDKYRKGIE